MASTPYRIIVEDPDGSERVFHATRKLLVGRSPEADIRIDEEGVSRIHCSIEVGAMGPEVKDLGSTNGTYVNGLKVERARLSAGDAIVVGRRPLRVIAETAEAKPGATMVLGATTIEHAITAGAAPYPPPRPAADHAAKYLEGLYHLIAAINRTGSGPTAGGPDLYQACLQAIMDVLAMDLGALFLGRSADALKPACVIDRSGIAGYEPSFTVINHVLKEQKTIIASDSLRESARSLVDAGVTRIFAAPLLAQGAPYGLVYSSSRSSSLAAINDDFAFFTAACQQLSLAFRNAEQRLKLEREKTLLLEAIPQDLMLAGRSNEMQRVRELMSKAAPFDTTVLITGESGTGKELIARGIHELSARREWLFVPVNCGAIPASMMESELFGHERGAFTGATQRRIGKLELANGGTLFLDEVAELPLELQVKLLRVLEDRTFARVGGNEPVRPDVRFLAATHRDLPALVREGKFREDLYFRLRVFEIQAPALRAHLDDLEEVVDVLLERLAQSLRCAKPRMSAPAAALLKAYSWPGNVRELRNVLERALILGGGVEILAENLSLPGRITEAPTGRAGQLDSLKSVEREHILRVLRATAWNKTLAAEILGIGRPTIYEKIKAYGLDELEGKT